MSKDNNTNNQKIKPTIDLSRRRVAKLGLLSAPIMSTLSGKPAMALYAKNNCTVSGNISGNMSDNAHSVDPCENYLGGKTPGYWKQHPEKWDKCGELNLYQPGTCYTETTDEEGSTDPDSSKKQKTGKGGGMDSFASGCQIYNDDGTKFHDFFGGQRQEFFDETDNMFKSFTMMQTLHQQGNQDHYKLDAHTIAALLNAECYGRDVYGYSPDEVIALYNEFHLSHPQDLKLAFQYLNQLDNPVDP